MCRRSVIAVVLIGVARPSKSSKTVSGSGISFSVSARNCARYFSLGIQLRCGALWCIIAKNGLPVASAASRIPCVTLVMFSVAYSPGNVSLPTVPSALRSQNHGSM